MRSLKPDAVRLGKHCATISTAPDHVEVRFEGGETVHATYVIGADGIHSTVRAALFGPDQPEFTGVSPGAGSSRWNAARASRSSAGTNWLGPARHVLHYPVRRGEMMNFVSFVERDDWQVEFLDDAAPTTSSRTTSAAGTTTCTRSSATSTSRSNGR